MGGNWSNRVALCGLRCDIIFSISWTDTSFRVNNWPSWLFSIHYGDHCTYQRCQNFLIHLCFHVFLCLQLLWWNNHWTPILLSLVLITMEIITILSTNVICLNCMVMIEWRWYTSNQIFVKTYIIHGLIPTQTHNIYHSRWINFILFFGRSSHIYVCFSFGFAHCLITKHWNEVRHSMKKC